MGISWTRVQVAVVAASVAGSGWLSAAAPAGATADGAQHTGAQLSSGSGVCGWFAEELPDRSEFVSICGSDSLGVAGDQRAGLPQPVVIVDRYACFSADDCVGEHHEIPVDRGGFTIDPLLRRARIVASGSGCAVEVEFLATATGSPQGGVSEHHGVAGGPWVAVFGSQAMSRPAEWWGRVCGRTLVAKGSSGSGEMWRGVSAGGGTFPVGGDGAETA